MEVETPTTTAATATTAITTCWSSIAKLQPPPKQPDQIADAKRVFEACKSTKGIAVAVVDANAIIQGGDTLTNCADKFVSVSDVIDEVRDPVSRRKLAFLPFDIETMEPYPEALRKVINFARTTGDLQTLSDVDLKLIALAYTLETQIHGTNHIREAPPPVHVLNVKRLPEKELPGWGSNVPNLKEWEALEHQVEDESNPSSRILPLKDINLNTIPADENPSFEDGSIENGDEAHAEDKEGDHNLMKPRRYLPKKKEMNIEGKKMVADGIDASQGQFDDNAGDWMPAVSRSTHRRFLRRKARRELAEASSHGDLESEPHETSEQTDVVDEILEEKNGVNEISTEGTNVVNEISEEKNGDEDVSTILNGMRLEESSLKGLQEEEELRNSNEANASVSVEGDLSKVGNEGLDSLEVSSETVESVDTSCVDDYSSEQSWALRSLSDSSVACVTSDFAMQNVILQMGLRLLAPGGMQIRQLHRWILKCHACNTVTAEIGRIFCPKCGNGGTLRKVAVTVGENGIVQAARRPRITLRGTKFSLPLPQGGRDAITKNPILREDQLPNKVLYPKTKKKSNTQGEDIFLPDHVFLHHTTDKKAPLKPPVRKALAVFSGRRNPNDNHFSRPKH